MKKVIKAYNLFYIFMCIIWPALQSQILHVDSGGRTIMFISFLAVMLNVTQLWNQKEIFATPAFLCWVVLLGYSMLNAFSKGFYAEWGRFIFLTVNFFHPFILLVIAMLELHRDKQTALKVIWIALGVYLLIGLPSLAMNLDDRLLVEGLRNLYPLHAVAFLFVSSILYVDGKIKTWLFVTLTIGITAIILASGTRKAFGAEVIILAGVILSAKEKRTWKNRITIILSGVLLVIGIKYVVNNTKLGSRFDQGEDEDFYVQLVENERINTFLMYLLGDRAWQYENAIEMHREHYWTGIGLTNYKDMSGTDYVLHSEYLVQLCENGTIGFVLLMMFYVLTIMALIINKKKVKSKCTNISFWGLAAILFINLTGWTYCMNYAMIFYAIILTFAYLKPEEGPKETTILINEEKKVPALV